VALTWRDARLVAVVTRLSKLFNTHSSMPALRKLVIPQNLSDPAPGREVASRVHFDQKPAAPGRFQFGLEATREGGAQVVARITTPVHAKP